MAKYEIIPIGQINAPEVCTAISVSPRYLIASYSSGQILVHDRRLGASQTFQINDTIFSVVQYKAEAAAVTVMATAHGILQIQPKTGQFIQLSDELHIYASRCLRIKPLLDLYHHQEMCFFNDIAYDLYEVNYEFYKRLRAQEGEEPEVVTVSQRFVAPCERCIYETFKDFAISTPDGVFFQLSKKKCLLRQNKADPVRIVDFCVNGNEIVIALSNGLVGFGQIGAEFEDFRDFGFKARTVWYGKQLYVGGDGMLIGEHGVVYQGGTVELVRGDASGVFFAVEGGLVYLSHPHDDLPP